MKITKEFWGVRDIILPPSIVLTVYMFVHSNADCVAFDFQKHGFYQFRDIDW